MAPAFHIAHLPGTDRIEIRLEGFFDADASRRFSQAWREAVDSRPDATRRQTTLLDVTDCMLVAAADFAAFAELFSDRGRASRRLAIVRSTALAGLQLRRLTAGRSDVRLFDDHAAARAWLTAED